jgi:hypothetical protein
MRILGILALAAAVAVQAGDPSAPPEDSIAAAKKDFAAIKAAPGDSGPLSGDRLAKPESVGPREADAAAPEHPPLGAAPAASGTGNWLVDAMERRPARSGQTAGGAGPIPGGLDLLAAMGSGTPGAGVGDKADRAGEGGAKVAPDSAVNPLDAFMEGWISARDKALLLPDRRTLPFLGGTESGPDAAAAGAFARPDAGGAKASANPYVADLYPAAAPPAPPELPGYGPLLVPDVAGPSLPLGPTTKPFEAPRFEIPDFAQSNDDDKYFREMRRF